MSNSFDRRLTIAGTYNLRDLGGYSAGSGQTRWRRILRADTLHRLQPDGIEQIIKAGIRTVVDLRSGRELESAPNPFRDHPDVHYVAISLFDQLVPPSVGRERQGDLLLVLYLMALADRQDAIREVLTAIAEARDGAVLFHCTGGKDRTGIIAALILGAVGVETQLILDDYALTKQATTSMMKEINAEATARGVDAAIMTPFLGCEPETMQSMLEHINERYGGVVAYLAAIGMEAAAIERLRRRFVGEAAGEATT
jgi:protein-tyrosine phosphatase